MIIGRQFAEKLYSENQEEKLYSTGNEELDELLERAFCEGYEYAQREFGNPQNKAANKALLISTQSNKLKSQGVPQFVSSGFKTTQNEIYKPNNLIKAARGENNKQIYGGGKSFDVKGVKDNLVKLDKENIKGSLNQRINYKGIGRGSIGNYKKLPGSIEYDHGVNKGYNYLLTE